MNGNGRLTNELHLLLEAQALVESGVARAIDRLEEVPAGYVCWQLLAKWA